MIQVSNMSKWYGKFHALKKINLKVAKGEKVIICGPSGSGKSSLIRCLNGIEDHQEGEIYVNDLLLTNNLANQQKIRESVGMVFQHFNLFPHLSVLENLTIAPIHVLKISKKEAEQRALKFLSKVKISELAQKFPSQISGGQKQRVAIARALCMNPEVMLFDEPTSALDPEMVKEVLDVMTELVDEGMTMITVTHEMNFARKIASRIIFMDHGEVAMDCLPSEFFDNSRNERAREFLSCLN